LPGNKISLPALPDFNAGKLLFFGLHFIFLRPSFYRLPTLGLFSDRTGWQVSCGRKKDVGND
jgi:hypothetical protein